MKHTLNVNGMHCKSCAMLITEALEDEGAKDIRIQLDEKAQRGIVTLESDKPKAELKRLIEAQGDYSVL